MSLKKSVLLINFILPLCYSYAQTDSLFQYLQNFPKEYVTTIEKKVTDYSNYITDNTEKTLVKLSKWENKIKNLLEKTSPETASKLFGNNQLTFNSVLQKFQEGKSIAQNYTTWYNDYLDKVNTNIKYLEQQKQNLDEKFIKLLQDAKNKIEALEENVKNTEAIEAFIRERKNLLIDESIKYIGKSKYLKNINKEAYYYVETLRNYKEVFSDPKKMEEVAVKILNKIPAFQKFAQQNSQLASLFALPVSFPGLPVGGSTPIVNGLASRASMQQYVQANMPAFNQSNMQQFIQGRLPDIKPELDQLQSLLTGGGMGNKNLPDFSPNSQHTKPFVKRLEYGFDFQFGKSVNYFPATSSIGLSIGYKLNDKSITGIGISYIAGLGYGWNKIHISSQGIGLRSFLKWKLKKNLDIQGGAEWNYMTQFKNIDQLKNFDAWQKSALLGLSKNFAIGKKVKGNFQALFDFLYNKHQPVTAPFVFRFGYNL